MQCDDVSLTMVSTYLKPSKGLPFYTEVKPKSLKCLIGFFL